MKLKIFVYRVENGELLEEYFYSDFLFVFNNIISHNFIYENDIKNLIIATEFPPKDLNYVDKEWVSKKKLNIKDYSDLIKVFN